MSTGSRAWADEAVEIGHEMMVPVHRVAVAWRALEAVRDRWIGHALDAGAKAGALRTRVNELEDVLEDAEGALGWIAPWRLAPSELDRRNIALRRVRVALGKPPVKIVAVDPPMVPAAEEPPALSGFDLRIDVRRGGIQTPTSVTLTHIPTGLTATAIRKSELHARDAAMRTLQRDVHDRGRAGL